MELIQRDSKQIGPFALEITNDGINVLAGASLKINGEIVTPGGGGLKTFSATALQTAGVYTLTEAESGGIIYLDDPDGTKFILPAYLQNLNYRFISPINLPYPNVNSIETNGSDTLRGGLRVIRWGDPSELLVFTASVSNDMFQGGGVLTSTATGTDFQIIAGPTSGTWEISGTLITDYSPATPFTNK